ncbi:MAG: 2-amino-4-hydroxy-6-hydroxymethyldihydropteridine diphosphokinase [Thermodesulfobacteriota bacterium]|jgi:2-amino-4-hydroxy-6-hydroxymethyldihydropteridine diphosphokinase|nr:2-amino-4-hydroxy-6-hydroxymethyldihydropteridine diphosphokinase [Thermodesulfobacteriota bacterium]
MESTFIALGSNEGDREANLRGARDFLQRSEGINLLASSALYETEPVGGPPDQSLYLNAVLAATTTLTARALLELCLQVEESFGRMRNEPMAPRTLDLDILFYGDHIIDEPDLVIPHPRLHERAFVLVPLRDLAPDLVHPVLKKSVRRLLGDFEPVEERKVRLWADQW